MAGNTVAIEFAGDADKLQKASRDANMALSDVGQAATQSSDDLTGAARGATEYTDRVGQLGAGVSGMTDAIDSAGAAVQGLADLQSAGVRRAEEHARAALDVAQAQEDYNQALRDGQQAAIDADQAQVDLKQAQLDAATAQKDYNEAVKEHGRDSLEARQALIDLEQAGVDVRQAQEDSAQAIRDGAQASIDAKGATLDLAEAQRAANPPDLQKWADQIGMITPILSGLVGVVGIVTAAQWAWNAAQLASPTTWIIVGIAALIAVIVLIATKTDWFQRAWRASWGWIKNAASNTWDFLKRIPGWLGSAFAKVSDFITKPFRGAFNYIARGWNNTIGSLSWTVPGWVPGIGGNSISVPNIPYFHTGGKVPGPPSSEMLAVLQGGERVVSNGEQMRGQGEGWVPIRGDEIVDSLIQAIARRVDRKGGRAATLGVRLA
jgi:hypothetical protein